MGVGFSWREARAFYGLLLTLMSLTLVWRKSSRSDSGSYSGRRYRRRRRVAATAPSGESNATMLIDPSASSVASLISLTESIQTLVDQLGQQPGSVAPDDRRSVFEQPPDERASDSQHRNSAVQQEERDHDNEAACQGVVRTGDCRLEGVGGKQDQGEVEQRELPDLAFAEKA